MRKILVFTTIVALFLIIITSCKTSNKTKGAVIGTVIGGATGAILTSKNKAVGIIVGAAAGGVLGGLVGNYMDKAANKIHNDLGNDATVTRVDEGVVISFNSGLLFDHNSYELRSQTRENLIKLSTSLKEFKDTDISILGHTDNTGTANYNQELSLQRSNAVSAFLKSNQIENSRLKNYGFGESDPVASNETDNGRQLNRRVEIVLVGTQELKNNLKK